MSIQKETILRGKETWHSIKYHMICERTDKAARFVIDGKAYWLPNSQIVNYPKNKTVEVPDWLYRAMLKMDLYTIIKKGKK